MLCLDVSTANTDRPLITYSSNSNNITNEEKASLNKKECSNPFESVQAYRLQNPKNVIIGHLNINSPRKKRVTVEELMRIKVDICLFPEAKLDDTFPNKTLRFMDISCIERTKTNTNMVAEPFFKSMKIFLV